MTPVNPNRHVAEGVLVRDYVDGLTAGRSPNVKGSLVWAGQRDDFRKGFLEVTVTVLGPLRESYLKEPVNIKTEVPKYNSVTQTSSGKNFFWDG